MRSLPGRCLVVLVVAAFISLHSAAGDAVPATGWQLVDGSDIPVGAKLVPPTEKVRGKFSPPDMPGKVRATVEVIAIVGLNGGVAAVSVESERPELIPAALEATEASKYEPATLDGKPVAVRTTHRYVFEKE